LAGRPFLVTSDHGDPKDSLPGANEEFDAGILSESLPQASYIDIQTIIRPVPLIAGSHVYLKRS
jgi:hypothetical protein